MSLFWSLKGEKNCGRAYWKTQSASIFIDNIYKWAYNYPEFISGLLQVMLHEYLHLFLKFRLDKWYYSEKTVIEPLSEKLCLAITEHCNVFGAMAMDFLDLSNDNILEKYGTL